MTSTILRIPGDEQNLDLVEQHLLTRLLAGEFLAREVGHLGITAGEQFLGLGDGGEHTAVFPALLDQFLDVAQGAADGLELLGFCLV